MRNVDGDDSVVNQTQMNLAFRNLYRIAVTSDNTEVGQLRYPDWLNHKNTILLVEHRKNVSLQFTGIESVGC